MTRDESVAVAKSTFVLLVKRGILSILGVWLPFINIPSVNKVLSFFLEKLLSAVADGAEMLAFFTFTDFRVRDQEKSFVKEALEFHYAKQSGDKDKIKKTENDFIAAFDKFGSFKS